MHSLIAAVLLLSSSLYAQAAVFSDGALVDVDSDQDQILTTVSAIQVIPVASDNDEVPTRLKILGKGVLNAETHESLAIACVGKSETENAEPGCNRLRVIEFDANRIPRWLGSAFEIADTERFQAVLKKEYRKKYRLHFLRVKKDVKRTQKTADAFGKILGVGVVGLLIAVGNAGGKGLLISSSAVAGSALVLGPIALLMILQSAKVDVVGAVINGVLAPFRGLGQALLVDGTANLTSTNGWSWSSQPSEVDQKKYQKIKQLLADFATGVLNSSR